MHDRLTAIGDRDLRQALAFARSHPGPFTAAEAAAALGVHHNVARARLDRLVRAGLLDVRFERRTGRAGPGAGRPAKVYAVAPQTAPVEFPEHRYDELLGFLLDQLPERGRTRALRRAGEAFGRELAQRTRLRSGTGVRAGLERVCGALRALGFHASVAEIEGDRAVLHTPTCPLRPLVVLRPEAAEIDRGMWAGLVERAVRGVRAETVICDTVNCTREHESCRVLLRLLPQDASSSGDTAKR